MSEEKNTKKFESDKIWDLIKDLPIEMYSLPNQKISDYVTKIKLPGDHLTVKLKSSAVLTSLEYVLLSKYDIELQDKFVLIKHKVKPVEAEAELAEVVIASELQKVKSSHK